MLGIDKPFVPDTNILLNAAFVSNSVASQTLRILSDCGIYPIIDDTIEHEAYSKIRQFSGGETRIHDQARRHFDCFLGGLTLTRVPTRDTVKLPKHLQHHHDRHVAAVALHVNGWVLSSDIGFVGACIDAEIEAKLPWGVLDTIAASKESIDLGQIIRVVPPSPSSGVIFARVTPGNWADGRDHGNFTVCDISNVGKITYNSGSGEWLFKTTLGINARCYLPLNERRQVTVAGSYRLNKANRNGNIVIRAALSEAEQATASESTLRRFRNFSAGNLTVGSSAQHREVWNGHLRFVVVGPQGLKGRTWQKLLKVPYGAPDPYDSDALKHVFQRLRATSSGLLVPTEEELMRS